jgi:hypothetical protein
VPSSVKATHRSALAFGEVLGLAAVGVVLAFEERDHRVWR